MEITLSFESHDELLSYCRSVVGRSPKRVAPIKLDLPTQRHPRVSRGVNADFRRDFFKRVPWLAERVCWDDRTLGRESPELFAKATIWRVHKNLTGGNPAYVVSPGEVWESLDLFYRLQCGPYQATAPELRKGTILLSSTFLSAAAAYLARGGIVPVLTNCEWSREAASPAWMKDGRIARTRAAREALLSYLLELDEDWNE
jgi:hypothetical protein